jgi:hypothetical protein
MRYYFVVGIEKFISKNIRFQVYFSLFGCPLMVLDEKINGNGIGGIKNSVDGK